MESAQIGDSTPAFADGVADELRVSDIWEPSTPVRSGSAGIAKLAESIKSIGLLQPVVVRFKDDHYELIAGNRRLAACKLLGMHKIPCHIVDLDDKTAFEVSLVENIQRRTMDPLEEAEAFQKYVKKYGWGSAIQLAMKLGKSSSYVSKRIGLLHLPSDVINKIRAGEIGASVAEELSSLHNVEDQSRLASLVSSRRVSLRRVRALIQERSEGEDRNQADVLFQGSYPILESKTCRAYSRAVVAMKIAMNRIALIMEDVESDWLVYEELMRHRNVLHSEIDLLLKE
ncbi:MAG: ParB/RepB/Spo0J family partition protein, partial [Nitrososphaerales archaeon]